MSRIPPTLQPELTGAVDLSAPRPVQPTVTRVEFHGCLVGVYVRLNNENICEGYKLQIIDPRNASQYELDFAEDILDEWLRDLPKFPRIGEKPEALNEETDSSDGDADSQAEVRDVPSDS